MSGINSTWFAPGWQETLGIGHGELQWPATGEFLTEETFRKYQRENPGDEVIIHAIPQDAFEAALTSPYTMIISDGLVFPNLVAHPRSSGTSARVLGRLVREERLLTLMEALRKMTLMPAQRLENRVPAMKTKGRIQVGADADLVLFDPNRVSDRATYQEPTLSSEGMVHVPCLCRALCVGSFEPGHAGHEIRLASRCSGRCPRLVGIGSRLRR
jgi:dihydroorotase